jgi:hypothetical protein
MLGLTGPCQVTKKAMEVNQSPSQAARAAGTARGPGGTARGPRPWRPLGLGGHRDNVTPGRELESPNPNLRIQCGQIIRIGTTACVVHVDTSKLGFQVAHESLPVCPWQTRTGKSRYHSGWSESPPPGTNPGPLRKSDEHVAFNSGRPHRFGPV